MVGRKNLLEKNTLFKEQTETDKFPRKAQEFLIVYERINLIPHAGEKFEGGISLHLRIRICS